MQFFRVFGPGMAVCALVVTLVIFVAGSPASAFDSAETFAKGAKILSIEGGGGESDADTEVEPSVASGEYTDRSSGPVAVMLLGRQFDRPFEHPARGGVSLFGAAFRQKKRRAVAQKGQDQDDDEGEAAHRPILAGGAPRVVARHTIGR